VSDIDIVVADGLKVLDLKRPIREADVYQPFRSKGVARRKAECLVDVRFGFFAPTKKKLREADKSMSAG